MPEKTLSKRGSRELKGLLRCLDLATEKVDALSAQAEALEAEADGLRIRAANLRGLGTEIADENGRATDEVLEGLGLPLDKRLRRKETEDGCLLVSWDDDPEGEETPGEEPPESPGAE